MNKLLLVTVISLMFINLNAMNTSSTLPEHLRKDLDVKSKHQYTCTACTPEQNAAIKVRVEQEKIDAVKNIYISELGPEGFARLNMSDEQLLAQYRKAFDADIRERFNQKCNQQ